MKEIRKKTDKFDPARLEGIESIINRLDRVRILFDGEDREIITDALKVHAALIRLFADGNESETRV